MTFEVLHRLITGYIGQLQAKETSQLDRIAQLEASGDEASDKLKAARMKLAEAREYLVDLLSISEDIAHHVRTPDTQPQTFQDLVDEFKDPVQFREHDRKLALVKLAKDNALHGPTGLGRPMNYEDGKMDIPILNHQTVHRLDETSDKEENRGGR